MTESEGLLSEGVGEVGAVHACICYRLEQTRLARASIHLCHACCFRMTCLTFVLRDVKHIPAPCVIPVTALYVAVAVPTRFNICLVLSNAWDVSVEPCVCA